MEMNTPEYEYLLGAYLGDGHGSRGTVTFTVSLDNRSYAEALVSTLEIALPGCGVRINTEDVLRVRFHRVALTPLFTEFKQNGVWSVPELDFPEHFLAGVIDTDGCISVTRRPSVRIVQAESKNIDQLEKLFDEQDILYRSYKDMTYTNYLGSFARSELAIRRKEDLLKVISMPFRNPNRIRNAKIARRFLSSSGSYRPIGDLEKEILCSLPATAPELESKLNTTSGNISYKLKQLEANGKVQKIGNKRPFLYVRR